MTPPTVDGSVVVYDGWTSLRLATVTLASGAKVKRHIEDHGASTCVLPFDPERRCALLVSMTRAPVLEVSESDLLEVPAGRVETMPPEQTARAEALEECGVALGPLTLVMHAWTMPAISAERSHMYIAEYAVADRVSAGGGLADEGEEIVVVEKPLDTLWAMLEAGTLPDLKTAFLLQALRLRRPELFGPGPGPELGEADIPSG